MKVLFVSSEMAPFAQTGGLGDVVGSLPPALNKEGCETRVIMPMYKQIKEKYIDECEFVRWSMVKLGWRSMYSGLFKMDYNGMTVYFIDNEFYFGHDAIYVDYDFDIERFAFFQRAVLEAIGKPMEFEPDLLHLNDWQTGMIPLLLEAHYKNHGYHENLQCIFTIHNIRHQGLTGRDKIADLLDLPDQYMSESGVLKDGTPNFMKTGIMYSNRVTTVSPTYADEILSDYYGEGLNGILGAQRWKLKGILNGIDMEKFNPKTDKGIEFNYNRVNWKKGKAKNKVAMQKEMALKQDKEKPMICMVTRLSEQKGIDLFLRIAGELLQEDVQVLVLGTGEGGYEYSLRGLESAHRDNMRAIIKFDADLARKLYAASDLFLMPSKFEPCGLAQMIAMRYGCLPIVRETGGLKDTVEAYNKFDGSGNGFSFANINAHELLFTIKTALGVYKNCRSDWASLTRTAMGGDYSWNKSAGEYIKVYEEILKETANA